jgi:hypothetical protein
MDPAKIHFGGDSRRSNLQLLCFLSVAVIQPVSKIEAHSWIVDALNSPVFDGQMAWRGPERTMGFYFP